MNYKLLDYSKNYNFFTSDFISTKYLHYSINKDWLYKIKSEVFLYEPFDDKIKNIFLNFNEYDYYNRIDEYKIIINYIYKYKILMLAVCEFCFCFFIKAFIKFNNICNHNKVRTISGLYPKIINSSRFYNINSKLINEFLSLDIYVDSNGNKFNMNNFILLKENEYRNFEEELLKKSCKIFINQIKLLNINNEQTLFIMNDNIGAQIINIMENSNITITNEIEDIINFELNDLLYISKIDFEGKNIYISKLY